MADVAEELYDLLSHHLLGSPYDPRSVHPERFLIDHLVEQVRWWELGSLTYAELRSIFSEHDLKGFSLASWIAQKASEDEYELPEELE